MHEPLELPRNPESFALVPIERADGRLVVACGEDSRGLSYALTELADRIRHADASSDPLHLLKAVRESPSAGIRSISRCFESELEDKPWFYDLDCWSEYLSMWTHGYDFDDVPNASHHIAGITKSNHARYCRDALAAILEACPDIAGVTFRAHVESGIQEGSYDFWATVFEAIAGAGRPMEIDLHAKGVHRPSRFGEFGACDPMFSAPPGRPRVRADLAMISPSCDTGPTWPNGRFYLLSAVIVLIIIQLVWLQWF